MTDWQRAWPAPAKINLFLHVVGRQPDGYHQLQTVFRFLDYGDTLRFSPRGDGEVVLVKPLPNVSVESDLTVRAARLLRTTAGIAKGVTIDLDKRLPMGGGLGGGSSDAATTLLALNRLWGCGLSSMALSQLGLRLGADVPVFIHGRNCFAEGIGERFTDLDLPPAWYVVVVPKVAVPTADVFRDPQLRRDASPIDPVAWNHTIGDNDLEPVACRLFPEVGETLRHMRTRASAHMSGSGACCFAEFGTETAARTMFAELPPEWIGFVAQGLKRHPLSELT